VLHYGRYGGDSDDSRLQDIFLGYSSLVHGYDPNSFSAAECGPQLASNGSCPLFDQLIGSKIGVANAEARLELLGPLGVIPSKPIPPVQAAWFYDTGEAWTSFSRAGFLGGARSAVSSYGGALRINLLGYAVGEISLAHPNDRPGRNWMWQFSLVPGW
jgi:outer membrane protein assembly factor BamA